MWVLAAGQLGVLVRLALLLLLLLLLSLLKVNNSSTDPVSGADKSVVTKRTSSGHNTVQ